MSGCGFTSGGALPTCLRPTPLPMARLSSGWREWLSKAHGRHWDCRFALPTAKAATACRVNQPDHLGSNSDLPRAAECLRQSREHHKVGVKLDTLQASDPERSEAEVVLQVSELSFHGAATAVEIAEVVSVAGDMRVVAASGFASRLAHSLLMSTNRDDRMHVALLASVVNCLGVVALIHRTRFRAVAASTESVEQRLDLMNLGVLRCLHCPRKRQSRL